jgi:hypothetical protein
VSSLVQNYLACELAGTILSGTWARWYKITWHMSSLVQNYLVNELAGTKLPGTWARWPFPRFRNLRRARRWRHRVFSGSKSYRKYCYL